MNRRQLIAAGVGAALLRFFPAWGGVEHQPRLTWEELLSSCGFNEVETPYWHLGPMQQLFAAYDHEILRGSGSGSGTPRGITS